MGDYFKYNNDEAEEKISNYDTKRRERDETEEDIEENQDKLVDLDWEDYEYRIQIRTEVDTGALDALEYQLNRLDGKNYRISD
jgi:hypothetical protein